MKKSLILSGCLAQIILEQPTDFLDCGFFRAVFDGRFDNIANASDLVLTYYGGRSGSDLLLYSYSNPPFAYIDVKRNGQYGRLLAQLHGNLTPAWFSRGPTYCLRRF